ncbi:MAG: hypothetical protein EXR69_01535 [Myxococcales bacterium]|nr:hypothetical protein [Myxococcales bacterium]
MRARTQRRLLRWSARRRRAATGRRPPSVRCTRRGRSPAGPRGTGRPGRPHHRVAAQVRAAHRARVGVWRIAAQPGRSPGPVGAPGWRARS